MKQKLQEISVTGIPIPRGPVDSLRWLTRLDTSALSHWSSVSVDIVIHPQAESSASLIRLLKSLQAANYHGFPLPGITIELPPEVEPAIVGFLSSFRWPPATSRVQGKLTVRRRTSSRQLTPITASLQTVESFYPINAQESHVLLLNPNVEVSPLFYHYLMFMLLEYKYSDSQAHLENNLAGISLDALSTLQSDTSLEETHFHLSQRPASNLSRVHHTTPCHRDRDSTRAASECGRISTRQ